MNQPILIHCDNLSKESGVSRRTKHIEVHYYYIRERILAGDIDLQYVGTNLQVADIFTKALCRLATVILSGSRPKTTRYGQLGA